MKDRGGLGGKGVGSRVVKGWRILKMLIFHWFYKVFWKINFHHFFGVLGRPWGHLDTYLGSLLMSWGLLGVFLGAPWALRGSRSPLEIFFYER